MPAPSSHPSALRPPVLLARLLAGLLVWLLAASGALAQGAPADGSLTPRQRIAAAKTGVDLIESQLNRPGLSEADLQRLRGSVDPLRTALQALQADVAGPRDAAKARLDKLGPAPKAGEPAESPDIADARKRETASFSDLDAVSRDAQLQTVRLAQLDNAMVERIREAFARQLTERAASVADPFFWTGVAADAPRASYALMVTAQSALSYFTAHANPTALGTAAAVVLAGFVAALFLRRRAARLRDRLAARPNAPQRFTSSFDTLLEGIYAILGWPMAALLPTLALRVTNLLPDRVLDGFGTTLVGALLIGTIFDAVGAGILSPGHPTLRLLPLSDWAVSRIRRRVRWMAVMLAVQFYLRSVNRAVYAPVSLTVAVTAISALLYAVILGSLLMRLRHAPGRVAAEGAPAGTAPAEEQHTRLDLLRPVGWMAILGVVGCLLAGYVAMAAFIANFSLVLLFAAVLAFTLVTLVDAALTDGLVANGARGRALGGTIGVSAKNVAFAATLLSGALRFLIVAAMLTLLAGPFVGFYSADMLQAVQHAFFGFQLGEITVSPSGILLGLVLFGLLVVATRLIQGWTRNTLLPRTTLDAGLQNSIATMIGYVGGGAAIAVGLSEVGLSLQNFAIVAGALSVGIGFGLQSIVSNFVSGLILLAERPIRVGDIVNVSGEEGYVRRISVRATAIETYDRATLIVPNSQLITSTVKNWVYGNTWSRVRIVLQVHYDADLDAVRAAMRAATEDDPRILPAPAPRVYLSKMGDAGLEFELIAVVASIETVPAVRSDLQLRILSGFRQRGIRMLAEAAPAAPAPVVANIEEVLAALGRPRIGGGIGGPSGIAAE